MRKININTSFKALNRLLEIPFKYLEMRYLIVLVTLFVLLFTMPASYTLGQGALASPANWLYPDGNSEATRYIRQKSALQDLSDSSRFGIKWSTDTIAGDLKPLIGNIIFNDKILSDFPFGPNEITAVIGGNVLVVDATGKTHKVAKMPPFVKDVTVLFDTLQSFVSSDIRNAVCLGIETVESENIQDSLAFGYIASYDNEADTIAILKRLAIDLRKFNPNLFGSIRPVFGRRQGSRYQIYGTMNMSKPLATDPFPFDPSYLRGLAQFNSSELKSFYPLYDIGDDTLSRMPLGFEVNFSQPSISRINGNQQRILLPSYPSTDNEILITNQKTGTQTYSNHPYILSMNMNGDSLTEDIVPLDFSSLMSPGNTRPQIRPFYLNITDGMTGDSTFILIAEEYRGVEGSNGKPKLHLFSTIGDPLSLPSDKVPGSGLSPSIEGNTDHLWSIAIGDIDGISSNALAPNYPNNRGKEILVTQSSREFVVPNNKLMVLRYYTGDPIPKKSPPDKYLNAFDTICTHRINGWLAAVNDIDGADDSKDEVFIVEGSNLQILRLFDYQSFEFRDGRYFDTVRTFKFDNETILNVSIADLEGDGKNDIIVTTNDRTYLIGTGLDDVIDFVYPKLQTQPPEQFCVGDTLPVSWENIFFKDKDVRKSEPYFSELYFRPYQGGVPLDTLIAIADSIDNEMDTIVYNYVVDDLVYGWEGRFIALRSDNPLGARDSSAYISFKYPGVVPNVLERYTYHSDEILLVSGYAFCLDSVTLEYSYDSLAWNVIGGSAVLDGGNFVVSGQLPCAPYYQCLEPDENSVLNVVVVAHKGSFADTSAIIPINLLPEIFPYILEPCETSCPTREFNWDVGLIDNFCDTVTIAIADINSNTFSLVERIPVHDGHYFWNIPANVPEYIKVRFCCENSCVRRDTVLIDIRPSYIGIVAPNPFKPPFEEVNVNYSVPNETYVTIRIYDEANRLVREIAKNEGKHPGIVYCSFWDGKIWDGSLAANGMYYISLELSDGQKEIYPVYVRK